MAQNNHVNKINPKVFVFVSDLDMVPIQEKPMWNLHSSTRKNGRDCPQRCARFHHKKKNINLDHDLSMHAQGNVSDIS